MPAASPEKVAIIKVFSFEVNINDIHRAISALSRGTDPPKIKPKKIRSISSLVFAFFIIFSF